MLGRTTLYSSPPLATPPLLNSLLDASQPAPATSAEQTRSDQQQRTFMRLNMSASIRTNLFDFFLTILGLTAGRRVLRAEGILGEREQAWQERTHVSVGLGHAEKPYDVTSVRASRRRGQHISPQPCSVPAAALRRAKLQTPPHVQSRRQRRRQALFSAIASEKLRAPRQFLRQHAAAVLMVALTQRVWRLRPPFAT